LRDFCEYSGIWKNRNNDTTEEHRFEGRFLYMRFLNTHMHWIFLSGTRTLMIGPNETTSTPGDTMKENLMRLPEVMKRTGFGRSQIYRLVNQKEFPNQIRLGSSAVAWLESEIETWIEKKIEASRPIQSDKEIKNG